MQWAGGVRRDKFNLNASAGARVGVPKRGTHLKNRAHNFRMVVLLDEEIDKSWTGNIRLADDGVGGQCIDDLLGKSPWRNARALCQYHGNVAGEIAVAGLSWPIDLRRGIRQFCQSAFCNELFQRRMDQRSQFGFHDSPVRIVTRCVCARRLLLLSGGAVSSQGSHKLS